MIRKMFMLLATVWLLGPAPVAWAACTQTLTPAASSDQYSANWTGTTQTDDCTDAGSNGWGTWNQTWSNIYQYVTTQLSFTSGASYGTKGSQTGTATNNSTYTDTNYVSNNNQTHAWTTNWLDANIVTGTDGVAGWSRDRTYNNNSTSNGTNNYSWSNLNYGTNSETGTQNWNGAGTYRGVGRETYDGTTTRQDWASLYHSNDSSRYSGTGVENGVAYTFSGNQTGRYAQIHDYRNTYSGFFANTLSSVSQYIYGQASSYSGNRAYADGRNAVNTQSYSHADGQRNMWDNANNYLGAWGRTYAYSGADSNGSAAAGNSNTYAYKYVNSSWYRSTDGGNTYTQGYEYFNDSRGRNDNWNGVDRTVSEYSNSYAQRYLNGGYSYFSSWVNKAWTFINGTLTGSSEDSGQDGDPSTLAFFTGFDPAVCAQFNDLANAQNADYSYWGLCLTTLVPLDAAPNPEPEPEACNGKAVGIVNGTANKNGNGQGQGLTKNRCETPSDSGKTTGKKA